LDNLNAIAAPNVSISPSKPKKNLFLPVLIVLFIISYSLLCILVIEQGSTIDAQRFLIRQLLGDSQQLSSMKMKHNQKSDGKGQANSTTQGTPQAQPGAQQPDAQSHGQQAGTQGNKDKGKTGKLRRPTPQHPPRDASEALDERRVLVSI